MKRFVGIMPLRDDEKDSIRMLPGYMDGVRQAGWLPGMIFDSLIKAMESGPIASVWKFQFLNFTAVP